MLPSKEIATHQHSSLRHPFEMPRMPSGVLDRTAPGALNDRRALGVKPDNCQALRFASCIPSHHIHRVDALDVGTDWTRPTQQQPPSFGPYLCRDGGLNVCDGIQRRDAAPGGQNTNNIMPRMQINCKAYV